MKRKNFLQGFAALLTLPLVGFPTDSLNEAPAAPIAANAKTDKAFLLFYLSSGTTTPCSINLNSYATTVATWKQDVDKLNALRSAILGYESSGIQLSLFS